MAAPRFGLALGCLAAVAGAAAAGASCGARARGALAGEAFSLVQTAPLRLHAGNASDAAAPEAPEFGEREAALSRMLYGFYMLASCPELLTPDQKQKSECKHCEAAGFSFRPGDLQIVKLREHFQVNDIVALVARVKAHREPSNQQADSCVLAIRGTQTFGNILSDIDFSQTPFSGCKGCMVHDGWLRQWKLLRRPVMKALSEMGCTDHGQALYITGHSSGCAVSDYAALDLHKARGSPVAASVGYDCPRPGNAAFARAFDEAFPANVWKVQVDLDPIRHLPPLWAGYREVGWAAQYLHGEREGFRACGRGGALCGTDRPPRLGDDLAAEIKAYHCAAPHRDTWSSKVYMRCDAKCDATLLEPEWGLLPAATGPTALLQPRGPERPRPRPGQWLLRRWRSLHDRQRRSGATG